MPGGSARSRTRSYSLWCVESTTPEDILAASRIEEEAKISFWDPLIIALAAKTGAEQVLSEDLNPDQIIAGVTVRNPFLDLPPLREDDAT